MRLWRPHTTGILIGGLVAILIAVVVSFILTHFQSTTDLRLGSGAFSAQIADTERERTKGLSGVSKMDPDDALIMVFDRDDTWGIWMKDMKVPIDILWLNSNKKVIYMVKNASPELSTDKTFKPNDPARYVIELPAGAIQANGIKVGEIAIFALQGDEL